MFRFHWLLVILLLFASVPASAQSSEVVFLPAIFSEGHNNTAFSDTEKFHLVNDMKEALRFDDDYSINRQSLPFQVTDTQVEQVENLLDEIEETQRLFTETLQSLVHVSVSATCRGYNYYQRYWWGWAAAFDSCVAQEVVNRLSWPGDVADHISLYLCDALPFWWCGYVASIVSATFGLNASAIASCANYGRGIYLAYTWWFPYPRCYLQ